MLLTEHLKSCRYHAPLSLNILACTSQEQGHFIISFIITLRQFNIAKTLMQYTVHIKILQHCSDVFCFFPPNPGSQPGPCLAWARHIEIVVI